MQGVHAPAPYHHPTAPFLAPHPYMHERPSLQQQKNAADMLNALAQNGARTEPPTSLGLDQNSFGLPSLAGGSYDLDEDEDDDDEDAEYTADMEREYQRMGARQSEQSARNPEGHMQQSLGEVSSAGGAHSFASTSGADYGVGAADLTLYGTQEVQTTRQGRAPRRERYDEVPPHLHPEMDALFLGQASDVVTDEGGTVTLVNPKQYYRILQRRKTRQRLEEMGRLNRQRKVRLFPSFRAACSQNGSRTSTSRDTLMRCADLEELVVDSSRRRSARR